MEKPRGARRARVFHVAGKRCNEPDIADCAIVQAGPNAPPAMFIVPKPGAPVDEARIRARLAESALDALPVPSIHNIDAIPKNANGKVLRVELRNTVLTHLSGAMMLCSSV